MHTYYTVTVSETVFVTVVFTLLCVDIDKKGPVIRRV